MHNRLVSRRTDALHKCFLVTFCSHRILYIVWVLKNQGQRIFFNVCPEHWQYSDLLWLRKAWHIMMKSTPIFFFFFFFT